jgi:hypothetical protein
MSEDSPERYQQFHDAGSDRFRVVLFARRPLELVQIVEHLASDRR